MAKTTGGSSKLDFATIGGIVVAFGAMVGGLLLEGGKISDISQVTAAMIVLGGTLGAVMINTPMSVLIAAAKRISDIFMERVHSSGDTIQTIVRLAGISRRNGIVSPEDHVGKFHYPFLKHA